MTMQLAVLASLLQVASLGATNDDEHARMQAPARTATWSDEFDARRIDPGLWQYDTSRNASGWPNHERQYYASDRPQNARIAHGALVIEVRREALSARPDWGGQAYSSAKLVSREALGFGFYEIRARLPCGRGMWPAAWLLPADGAWPDEGEIDIMEMVGWQPNVVHATVHSGAFNHRLGTQRGSEKLIATSCTAFHRYQLDWQPGSITIGADGTAYMRVTRRSGDGKPEWPFDRPYQMILNLAVGGDWGGVRGIDDATLPQRMTIDYVRYWRK